MLLSSFVFLISCEGQIGVTSSEADAETNLQPLANAGNNLSIKTGALVRLDASNSRDPDQDALSYKWYFISQPSTSNASLQNSNTVSPEFVADVSGVYLLGLVVSDGLLNSFPAQISISSATLNSVPVANAGADQNVLTNSTIMLNGSNSSDADGDILTFNWVLSVPGGSNAVLVSPNSVTPSFMPDIDGIYTVSLIVNDGTVASASDAVSIISTTGNSVPVADAGADQSVSTGDTVNLNGQNSNDADGDNLIFLWVLAPPAGSSAVLNSTSSISPSFTADIDGAYVVSLTVNDGSSVSLSDSVVVTSSTSNSMPVANAGIDQNIPTGSLVKLDAASSSDADGDSLSFSWLMTSRPVASNASLAFENTQIAEFTADVDGEYIISLTVNDGALTSQADSVLITAATSNSAPVANAGIDKSVTTGDSVILDGSNSTDINNDNLTYSWALNIPAGSSASLDFTNVVMPTFTADIAGEYIASLIVNDGVLSSTVDRVLIQATAPSTGGAVDSFDGTGALIGYTTNNASKLPDVSRVNGRYRANLIDNAGDITLHYQFKQGRLDAKQVSFPFEVIVRNIGIGTQADSQVAPVPSGTPYIFAGIQVHALDFASINSSHIVVGHRGGSRSYTLEGKNTVNGVSAVDDMGQGAAPDGRADLRVVGNADKSLTIYWQQPNLTGLQDNWQLYKGTGNLPSATPAYGSSVYVGIITYAQGLANVPFVGTADSFEVIQN